MSTCKACGGDKWDRNGCTVCGGQGVAYTAPKLIRGIVLNKDRKSYTVVWSDRTHETVTPERARELGAGLVPPERPQPKTEPEQ